MIDDPSVQAVEKKLTDIIVKTWRDKIRGIIAHGSAVKGGYIPNFSDYDIVIVHAGEITLDDSLALHQAIKDTDPAPFSYFQISTLVPEDKLTTHDPYLLKPAHKVLYGPELPENFFFTDESLLTKSKRVYYEDLPKEYAKELRSWSIAVGPKIERSVRLGILLLRNAVRLWLIMKGESAVEIWSLPLTDLPERLRKYDEVASKEFAEIITLIPPSTETMSATGNRIFTLLHQFVINKP